MKLININGVIYHHGDKVTCTIQNEIINDAKIFIEEVDGGHFCIFICQNICDGVSCGDCLGYHYSWEISGNLSQIPYCLEREEVSGLRLLDESIIKQIVDLAFPIRK